MFTATTHDKGFTLIQLLFSIVIMGILISVVITSINPGRIKGRDSKRLSDLNQMKVALEFYREANGNYPYTCSTYFNASFDSSGYAANQLCTTPNGTTVTGQTLTQAMAPYVAKLSDPKLTSGDSGYLYVNQSNASSYCFMIWRTPENLKNFPSYTIPPTRCGSVGSDGQCGSAGTFGAVNSDEAVYIGKGTYAGGC
jgi:type II secretory pathway pseudopilin PulG